MYILHKYLIKNVIKHFSIITALVVGIYLVVDFFEKIDKFMEAGAPLSAALWFFLYKTPFIIAQTLPVGIMLSVLVTLGLMGRHNELIALRSSGIGIYTLFKPMAAVGLASGILLFFLSEVVVPISMSEANSFYLKEVKKVSAVATRENNIWIKGNRIIAHIQHYNPLDRRVFGVTIHQFDEQFKLIRRLDASRGFFQDGTWVLENIMEQVIDRDTNAFNVTFSDRQAESVKLLPEDLKRVAKKSEEMGFEELRNYISTIEAEGYDAGKYRVDLHAKAALPFVCLIMCMVGSGIAVRKSVKEGLPIVLAYGIGLVFVYWVVFSLCLSLGYGGMLPPVVAAWLANLAFSCLGGILLLNAD